MVEAVPLMGAAHHHETAQVMFVIIGWVVAMGCIFGAYIVHGGNMGVILKALPTEMLAILGGAIGAFVVNNQPKVLKATIGGMAGAFKGSKYTKARYLALMALLYDFLAKARKEGLIAIERDVEEPDSSPIFQRYPEIAGDHHLVEFITGGPLVAAVIEGPDAIVQWRNMMGATNPVNAPLGTIRGDLATEMQNNVTHGSDSEESAAREVALFFPGLA